MLVGDTYHVSSEVVVVRANCHGHIGYNKNKEFNEHKDFEEMLTNDKTMINGKVHSPASNA